MKKREFLRLTSILAAGAVVAPALTFCGDANTAGEGEKETADSESSTLFELAALPYAFDALEPYIDARTMEIHHDKHHAGYTSKLNTALESNPGFAGMSIEDILKNLNGSDDQTALRNNAGGYYNHNLYWKVMSPNGGGMPSGQVADAINAEFGSFESFKSLFSKAATGVFGSGWAWLCAKDGSLSINHTPNQDNPLMTGVVEQTGSPILGIDVWEHAYYLNYQNRRGDYVENFFNVINWDEVNLRLSKV
jgi:Fe-Mn family superoxide dismutase